MDKILITGIGLVGAQLVKKIYKKQNIKPVVLDIDFHWPYLDTILDRNCFIPVKGSILDQDLVADALRRHDIQCIVHTAAVLPMRVGHDAHPGFYQVNTWGTANLMFSAKKAGIERFIMFSTNGVYQFREHKVDAPVTENFPSGLSPHNSYGNSKATAEFLLRELTGQGAFDGKIIRPGEIYGPVMSRPGEDPIYWKGMLDAAIEGKPFVLEGHPEHRLDWVYCKDIAEIAHKLILAEKTPHVEYNATYGKCIGIYDFKAQLDSLFPGNKIELRNCGKGGWNFPLSMERSKKDLNFTPKYNLQKGLEDYSAWYQKLR
ncbi:MAG: NAD-dependent epimerase/dehydratase family protein [Desulfobacterales bacterium]